MFERVRGGLASCALVVAVFGAGLASVAKAEGGPFRQFDKSIVRTAQGTAADGSLAQGQIAAWYEKPFDDWINTEIARLEPLITDPAIVELAKSDTQFDESGEAGRGFNLQSTVEAFELLKESGNETQVKYLLLNAVKKRDPWAAFNLGNLIDSGDVEGPYEMAQMAWRRAADLDFQPGLININDEWLSDKLNERADVIQAYVLYSFEMNAPDGGWISADHILHFYSFAGSKLENEGYVARALIRAEENGLNSTQAYYYAILNFDGAGGVTKNRNRSLLYFLRAAKTGEPASYRRLSEMFRYPSDNDLDIKEDIDLAYDFAYACIVETGFSVCFDRLANIVLFRAVSDNDRLVGAALAEYCLELDPESGCWNAENNGDMPDLGDAKNREAVDAILGKLRERDYAGIAALKPGRPLDPEALLVALLSK